ncbi:MAG TPA: hypothetical protein PKX32_05760, partial [Candidatus Saccharicenans sp.]|nr:hypothetical protein [Candidatus Saccharicenans sp.]
MRQRAARLFHSILKRIYPLFSLVLILTTAASAYIGPGAGFAFLSSFLIFFLTFFLAFFSILSWPFRWFFRQLRG